MVSRKPSTELIDDAKEAAKVLGDLEVGYLVDMYRLFLERKVAIESRIRTLPHEPNRALTYTLKEIEARKNDAQLLLDIYTDNHPIASVMKKIKGVGPVISAGFVAYVNMDKAPYFTNVLAYGGYSPNAIYRKGEKRSFNMDFRQVLIMCSRSFTFASGSPDSYFGWHYKMFKRRIQWHNEQGHYAEKARQKLEKYKIRPETVAYANYSKGKLPPGHIVKLAACKCVSLFVGIVHEYWARQIGKPVTPFPFEFLGHDIVNMKTMEEVLAFEEAKRAEAKRLGRKNVPSYEEYKDFIAETFKGDGAFLEGQDYWQWEDYRDVEFNFEKAITAKQKHEDNEESE